MPLLSPDEYTIAALMADLPMKRAARHQLQMQLLTLQEGLDLTQNPLQAFQPIQQHRVAEGETLPIVSVRLWGTPNYWRLLAETNKIEYPYTIYPGLILQVPEVRGRG